VTIQKTFWATMAVLAILTSGYNNCFMVEDIVD